MPEELSKSEFAPDHLLLRGVPGGEVAVVRTERNVYVPVGRGAVDASVSATSVPRLSDAPSTFDSIDLFATPPGEIETHEPLPIGETDD